MKYFLFVVVLIVSSSASAAKDVSGRTIDYVYQPDLAPTEFDFAANLTHGCGTNIYRVRSNDEATANRKFSIILAAFTSGKKIAFHDTEVCAGNRSIVSWVRITK